MRLIDADALRERMRELWSGDPAEKWQILHAVEPVVFVAPTVRCEECGHVPRPENFTEFRWAWCDRRSEDVPEDFGCAYFERREP